MFLKEYVGCLVRREGCHYFCEDALTVVVPSSQRNRGIFERFVVIGILEAKAELTCRTNKFRLVASIVGKGVYLNEAFVIGFGFPACCFVLLRYTVEA
ncbi:hypothetical protein SDC9_194395 [bioreactor metagenome]|uniref:Uncharacterized protein n=1 Tax=bioreactor metagenome TaxID=1076179 RepID=A0A645I7C0_9ZZZZ